MANVKKSVRFIKRQFEKALARKGYSKNQFAKELFPSNEKPLRKLQKYMQNEEIPPEILDKIAMELNVKPEYLTGEYRVTFEDLKKQYSDSGALYFLKKEIDSDGYHFGDYWTDRYSRRAGRILDRLIAFLNSRPYTAKIDGKTIPYIKFNFRDLNQEELEVIEDMIFSKICEYMINPPNESWKHFIRDTIRALDEETEDGKEGSEKDI